MCKPLYDSPDHQEDCLDHRTSCLDIDCFDSLIKCLIFQTTWQIVLTIPNSLPGTRRASQIATHQTARQAALKVKHSLKNHTKCPNARTAGLTIKQSF